MPEVITYPDRKLTHPHCGENYGLSLADVQAIQRGEPILWQCSHGHMLTIALDREANYCASTVRPPRHTHAPWHARIWARTEADDLPDADDDEED